MIKNQIKTVLLLGGLTGLLLFVGSFWGYSGMTVAFIFAVLINVGSYWFSDKIVLKMYRAKEAKENDYPNLFNIVKDVSSRAGIPMPKVYIVPGTISNAFAVGRNYKHAAVAFTQGILDLMNEEELKGVAAHEISHIKNRDTLIQTMAATIAGVISYVAFMARWGAIFGGFGGRDNNNGGGIVELLVLAILTPLLATIIQLAISRSREYLADESAARILKNGNGLADGLEKLESAVKARPLRAMSTTETTAHLFIINPFGKLGGLKKLFSTHPAVSERTKRLRAMKF